MDIALNTPTRGFHQSEFEARTARAQEMMATAGMSAILVLTSGSVRTSIADIPAAAINF